MTKNELMEGLGDLFTEIDKDEKMFYYKDIEENTNQTKLNICRIKISSPRISLGNDQENDTYYFEFNNKSVSEILKAVHDLKRVIC